MPDITRTALPLLAVAIIVVALAILFFVRGERFGLPRGETVPLDATEHAPLSSSVVPQSIADPDEGGGELSAGISREQPATRGVSMRQVFVTDGVKHSIPLNEILSGGPGKDGIPSIDEPVFIAPNEADSFLDDSNIGLGLVHGGEARFYPYQILVWHEIVNDTVQGDPLLVTYCPLCATGVVFDRRVGGVTKEFGVSGMLWQSNLLMYDRAENVDSESLWSQVLGEAVLGEATGARLAVLPSDTVRYGDWKRKHPETKVLSRETGASRPYGTDPYGDYYTNDTVSFGATFDDDRLSPKEFVLGVELNEQFKAYAVAELPEGTTMDVFAGERVTIEKSDIGEVRMFIGSERTPLPYIGGFWFSWIAVHPETELYGF